MSKRMYEDLQDMLKHEMNDITKKGKWAREDLDDVHKIISSLKSIDMLMKSEKEKENGGASNYSPYSYNMPMGYAYNTYNQGGNSNRSYDMNSNRQSYESYEGNSNDGRRGRDADNDGRYSEDGSSYRRGRDAMGRYTSRDDYSNRESRGRYSRHTAAEKMVEKLETMLDTATTQKDRMAIEECIDKLEA